MSQSNTFSKKANSDRALVQERHGRRIDVIKRSIADIRSETGVKHTDPVKNVYLFREGNKQMSDILGGKGANLAEMVSIGLPGKISEIQLIIFYT